MLRNCMFNFINNLFQLKYSILRNVKCYSNLKYVPVKETERERQRQGERERKEKNLLFFCSHSHHWSPSALLDSQGSNNIYKSRELCIELNPSILLIRMLNSGNVKCLAYVMVLHHMQLFLSLCITEAKNSCLKSLKLKSML